MVTIYPKIDELMTLTGCLKWPQRWREIYDTAMADFEEHGCPYTDPAFYESLHREYGVLSTELDTYRQAAIAVGENEHLSRLLHLLCTALTQEEFNFSDTEAFKLPFPPDTAPCLARDMLQGLAICSQLPGCAERLHRRNLPEALIRETLCLPEITLREYRARHGGLPGFDLLDWYQRTIAGSLFPMGRLEMELFVPFCGNAWVFQNEQGQTIALAHDLSVHRDGVALGAGTYEDPHGSWEATITETETFWEGHPFGADSLVQKQPVRLEKSRWKKVLAQGDPVVQLHIPSAGKLSETAVTESIERMRAFLHDYYPDYAYRAFACGSWLLNPILEQLLGDQSNIVRFGRRFFPLTRKIHGTSVFYFVFMQPNNDCPLEDLPENTRLEKVLKEYYLSGKVIHETVGYFF